jgi:F-type H+-transporting ATPase subunit delta
MKDRKVAARYARALLAALPDEGAADAAASVLDGLAKSFQASGSLRDVLLNPAIPKEAARSVLDAIAERTGASRLVRNFLGVLVSHGRAGLLPAIADEFAREKEARQGIVRARVRAATELPADLRARLEAALERLTGRHVRVSVEVEPDLIGGAVASVGSFVFDGSLRGQLERLRRTMAGD